MQVKNSCATPKNFRRRSSGVHQKEGCKNEKKKKEGALSWDSTYRIMSSIILPMEICRVPSDSWAGRM
jgi:hypothetical protein